MHERPPAPRTAGGARQAGVLLTLVRQDLRNRYAGAAAGLLWSFVQPLVMALILWFVFAVAWRRPPIGGAPFIAWFLASLAAWTCFAEGLGSATQVFREYAFLVKKVRFDVGMLPMVKILSAAAVHGLFLLVVIGILLAVGIRPSWYWLQTLYYLAGLILLLQGLGWITASLNVFVRDTAHGVQVLLQLGFWATPIVWDFGMLPDRLGLAARLLRLNPMVTIVRGYRHSLVEGVPLWADGWDGLYFWVFTALAWWVGRRIFRSLKPQFADVL